MNNLRTLEYVYRKIQDGRKKHGNLKKCEFHLHTPASHDYRLIENKSYNDLTTLEVIEFAVEQGYITPELKNLLLKDIDTTKPDAEISPELESPFSCLKEQISYDLITHKIFKEKIDVVLISDHNTIAGFEKLKFSRDKYYSKYKTLLNKNFDIFLGVEISCSEHNHVVAIFDNMQDQVLQSFLKDIVMSETEGTYHTSLNVLEMIHKKGGIGYIAHVNTVNWWSGAYNTTLLNSPNLKFLGFTNYEKAKEQVSQRCTRTFCYIREGDAHEVNQIGINNVWIKFSKVNFNGIKRAISDYGICIYNSYPDRSDKYIEGVLVVSGDNGFLVNAPNRVKDDDETTCDFVVSFSQDLNCIIGGRGTGKSTLLHVLESVFNIDFAGENSEFQHVAKHDIIYVLFYCKGKEYMLRFLSQTDEDGYLLNKAFKIDHNGNKVLSDSWFEVYHVENQKNFIKMNNEEATTLIRRNFYRRGYSINKLISMIDRGTIGSFIRDTILYGLSRPIIEHLDNVQSLYNKPIYIKFLRDNFKKMLDDFEDQEKKIKEILQEFNAQYSNTLSVIYSPNIKQSKYYLEPILKLVLKGMQPITISKGQKKFPTYITWDDVGLFVMKISEKMGYLQFLESLFFRRYSEIEKFDSIANYASIPKTIQTIQQDYLDAPGNLNSIYGVIYSRITSPQTKNELLKTIEKYFQVIDDFSIHFNINKKEAVTPQKIVMRPIEELSLGQKVVALLTFVFEFGKFVNDNSPLILDQPEDNLDNQYIFQNLVESLRAIKNKRQVIVVTHSSTIVTNADAEQVIVMGSDNKTGWLDTAGYPNETVIVKHILNHLEGGSLSFRNKFDKYKFYIGELNGA